jgi:hypothetical protein
MGLSFYMEHVWVGMHEGAHATRPLLAVARFEEGTTAL